MSISEQLQAELEQVRQAIKAQETALQYMPEEQRETIESILETLREKKAEITTLLTQSGATVQGDHNTVIGQDGLNVQDANISGNVVSGDSNTIIQGDNIAGNKHITYIIQQTSHAANDPDLQQELINYLNWVIATNRTITLRGVQHSGRNVIELDLDTVYVPLQAVASMKTGRQC